MFFKVLGITALLTVISIFATVSSASALLLHSETAPVKITGEQTTQLVTTVNTMSVKCSGVKLVGENKSTKAESTLFEQTYSGCVEAPTGGGGEEPTNTTCKNCSYETKWFGLKTKWRVGEHTTKSESIACTVSFAPEQEISGISFKNIGAGKERAVVETLKETEIEYTETGSGCKTPGTHKNGTFTGAITYRGTGQGIWVE